MQNKLKRQVKSLKRVTNRQKLSICFHIIGCLFILLIFLLVFLFFPISFLLVLVFILILLVFLILLLVFILVIILLRFGILQHVPFDNWPSWILQRLLPMFESRFVFLVLAPSELDLANGISTTN